MVPEGWERKQLVTLGQKSKPAVKAGPFGSALKKEFYVPSGYKVYGQEQVISQNASYGNYYVDEEKYLSLKNCAVKPGDILISLVGTVGKVLLLPENCEPGIINPRLLRISPSKDKIYGAFLKYFLESGKTIKTLLGWAQGGTMGVLNAEMVKKLEIPLPPIYEQKKIAQILSTWDKAIATTEQLLANSQQQKKALMQQLVTGRKRFPEFKGHWDRLELGSLLEYNQPTAYLVNSTDYNNDYEIPVLTAGKTFILGYTNESEGIYKEKLPVIIFDDFTTDSKFVDFPFKAKSSAMKILTARKGVSIKYVFEAMQLIDFTIGGHQRHWISIFSNLVIALPKIAEQQKIASVLFCADAEIETLKQKLHHLKQEKKALMQQLLTGKRRVKTEAA